MISDDNGPLPIGRDSLNLPKGNKPDSFRYSPTCCKCISKGIITYQTPHGDGRNYDLGCVEICKRHNCVIDSKYLNMVCDDFILSSWELRGIRDKQKRIDLLLDLRENGIEVEGSFRNVSSLDMPFGTHPDKDKDILEGL